MAVTMHELLNETSHRPWPVPDAPWIMEQTWVDLLFAHWTFPVDVVRAVVPPQLPVDTFEGHAWVGVVPFMLHDLRPRGLPALPPISSFPELNVRTYVTIDGKPGVYFFSLDAASRLAVMGARTVFHLNYFDADMSITRHNGVVEYSHQRTDSRGRPCSFRGRYEAVGEVFEPQYGTLEHFLTERYCLYTVSPSEHVYRLQIQHRPWLLQPAEAELDATQMLAAAGLPAPSGAPLLHFCARQPMIGWSLERLASPT